jgi:hypothetical protein
MRSRAARVMSSAVAWVAIAGAALFLFNAEQQLSSRRTALRAFDQHAREATEALADVRAGQQAYVAAGQGVSAWTPKVAAMITQTAATVDTLRAAAVSGEAQQELVEAAAAITQLSNVDRRARDYIREGEQLMAGDVVFAEGGDVASSAVHQIETARLAEYRGFDAEEMTQRRLEALVLGGAAALSALVMAILAFAHGPAESVATTSTVAATAPAVAAAPVSSDALPRKPATPPMMKPANKPATVDPSRESTQALRAAAVLCTEFGSARDSSDLSRLLAQAGSLMDASGLIVWIGSVHGGDLRPVLAHGYAEETLARIPPVPRSADNAAAAAYRTGSMQIVAARAGASAGALVVPILGADGCIGALTAEIRDRGETSESIQALATIFAAQLAGLLATAAVEADDDSRDQLHPGRMASA